MDVLIIDVLAYDVLYDDYFQHLYAKCFNGLPLNCKERADIGRFGDILSMSSFIAAKSKAEKIKTASRCVNSCSVFLALATV